MPDLYADAFYSFNLDTNGKPINVALLAGGLYIDNSQYTPVPTAPFPPFNENHQYSNLPFTGTGNPLSARMVFSDYTMNQSADLNITVCKKA